MLCIVTCSLSLYYTYSWEFLAIAWLTSARTHVAEFGGVDETVGGVVFGLT